MKYASLLLLLFAITLGSCEKEQNRRLLNAYINFKVNGVPVHFSDGEGINENTFECITRGDTALIINGSKLYQGIGFNIQMENIKNGTYHVDSINTAYYNNPSDYKRYITNSKSTGMITIRKGTFEAKSILNIIEGEFSFVAEDTLTKRKFNITEGSFMMERQEE